MVKRLDKPIAIEINWTWDPNFSLKPAHKVVFDGQLIYEPRSQDWGAPIIDANYDINSEELLLLIRDKTAFRHIKRLFGDRIHISDEYEGIHRSDSFEIEISSEYVQILNPK
jgi:hypothetical protein